MCPLLLALLAVAATAAAASPLRNELPSEELYSGYIPEAPYDESKTRNLDSIESAEGFKSLMKELRRYSWKKGGGTLDSLGGGHLLRDLGNLDTIGGGNLLRELESGLLGRSRAYMFPRSSRLSLDSLRGGLMGSSKRAPLLDTMRVGLMGTEKRNGMDEIERSGFNSFIKKKNFDEIDRSGFDGFVKRNFDEIDRSGFNGFVKRAAGNN